MAFQGSVDRNAYAHTASDTRMTESLWCTSADLRQARLQREAARIPAVADVRAIGVGIRVALNVGN
jgi:hypothetical protein